MKRQTPTPQYSNPPIPSFTSDFRPAYGFACSLPTSSASPVPLWRDPDHNKWNGMCSIATHGTAKDFGIDVSRASTSCGWKRVRRTDCGTRKWSHTAKPRLRLCAPSEGMAPRPVSALPCPVKVQQRLYQLHTQSPE